LPTSRPSPRLSRRPQRRRPRRSPRRPQSRQPAAEAPAAEVPVAEAPAAEAPATETPAAEAPAAEAPAAEAPATETPAAEAPAAEAPDAANAPAADGAPADEQQGETAAQQDRHLSSPARLTAAIERVGGAEIIKEALKPKQDEKGQPLKWAAVCAQAAEGLKPGDPVFNAWVRLAATPVREVKAQLPRPPETERGSGRPGESAGRRPGGQRPGGGRPDRGRRDGPSRQEFASHAQDGTLRKSVRIITGHDEDQERRDRDRIRKEQRDAKRRAERERLARLGY